MPMVLMLTAFWAVGVTSGAWLARRMNPAIGDELFEVLKPSGSMNARQVVGGTAPVRVLEQIARHRQHLE